VIGTLVINVLFGLSDEFGRVDLSDFEVKIMLFRLRKIWCDLS